MKKFITIIICALLVLGLACAPAFADTHTLEQHDGRDRVIDTTGHLSSGFLKDINALILDQIDAYQVDFAVAISDDNPYASASQYARELYGMHDYGYGAHKDGIIFLIDLKNALYVIQGHGAIDDLLTETELDKIYDEIRASVVDAYNADTQDAYEEMVKSFIDYIIPHINNLRLTNNSNGLPGWYPLDISSFKDFHNEDRVPLFDNADMFTPDEEKALSERITALIKKYDYDFVLFTDMSTHGLSRGVYAADFYQFNGYGIGDNYSGTVLFICMQPGNRGWWTAARGDCKGKYTESIVNKIDDAIEPYMISGDYFEAMNKYLDKVEEFYEKGNIRTPIWPIVAPFVVGGCFLGIIFGLIGGFSAVRRESKKMNTIRESKNADHEKLSVNYTIKSDQFLYRTTHRSKHVESSGGGGGGGRSGGSSYSGSYSSSGGGSFSGGGRSF